MNRIIKFRAWDKKEKKMFGVLQMSFFYQAKFNQNRNDGDLERGAIKLLKNDNSQKDNEWQSSDSYILMQFTGLLDKNSKEIYEGDVINYSIQGDNQNKPIIVEIPGIYVELGHDDPYYLPDEDSFEIIGNIYSNPELLTNKPMLRTKKEQCEVCGGDGYLSEYMGQYEWCAKCEPEKYKRQHEQVLTAFNNNPMKKEYKLTIEEKAQIIEASKPTPVMYLSGGESMYNSPQENANKTWEKLGEVKHFDYTSVEPSPKGEDYFLATPI